MTYPRDIESKLGFDQIRGRIADYCLSSLGRKLVDKVKFSSNFTFVETQLRQGREFKNIKEKGETFPLSHCYDPSELYPIIMLEGSFIETESIREIGLSLETIFACRNFLKQTKEVYPHLYALTISVVLSDSTVGIITSKLDDTGHIKDNASPELAQIRKKLKAEENKTRRLVDQLFRDAVGKGYVPEGMSPVIREGRVVIPISSEHKRRLKGIIIDESATGQTVFMEPTEVIEANNEIRDLELAERREIVKILKQLTSHLRENLDDIKTAFQFLSQLDFIQAKTRFSMDIDADLPQLSDKPDLNWLQARHPLLYLSHKGKSPVVPLTIDLLDNERFLLVSGPNAGGKSVCLKTVGLVQYMAQCGLLVPLHEKSTVGIFKDLFLDIGDQQSIENDLSTYSSHLRNMRYFVAHASADTLVLLDELGAGTDPNFGGGIAQAILADLVAKNVWGVATTHYYNLKLFAEENLGIRNGAMQFDSKQLNPLFVLEIGKPGSSFALEIARKTGLPKSIVEEAEKNIGKDLTGLESLMKKVADEKQQLAKREASVKSQEIKYKDLLNKYNQLSQELEARKKDILTKAKEEAAMLLKQTNKEIEKTIRHIKENRAEKKETRKVRQGLLSLEERVKPVVKEPSSSKNEIIKEGDRVRMIGQEVTGKVVSIKGSSALVQFGDMRSSIKLGKLVKSDGGEVKSSKSVARASGIDIFSKQSNFTGALDVRGKRAEEIIPVLDQFMDDAVLLGYSQLRILHGKGEGVLRKMIRERLKENKSVESFADEHADRGGDGITLVVLK